MSQQPNTYGKQPAAFYAGLVFFVCSVIGVIWLGVAAHSWLQGQQAAPVQQVKLYGNFKQIEASSLHQLLQHQYVGNFFWVDVAEVQEFILQQPWVYQVAVRKQWPDALVVVVTEQQPVARWNQQQLINKQGDLFTAPIQELTAELPLLTGPEGSQQDALAMFEHIKGLLALYQYTPASLTLTERFSWQLTLSDGIALKLGREDILKRVQRFVELHPVISKYKTEPVSEVDLRYDTGIAVRYSNNQTKRKA
ncbi:cell division protein FtsQ/DivIB [Rheinheimera sp. MMS21-TC3]|uniref:cell division protein FtsQ/DivIB n=1 Tax=Rheinheimera sp. MMS21-TC3 TaxID=3072790 RepID=UPI0028C44A63|nr:cell division protein FtsQ/DivIB [Rheinheimera sp. MMS21-TC3]WNO60327.1 cell division protein FtsQ/DivIB [Rheinheimera sp. MMS21-TC3]